MKSEPTAPVPDAEWPFSEAEWNRVSPKYAWADLLTNVLTGVVVSAALIVGVQLLEIESALLSFVLIPAVVASLILNAVLAFRRVRAIGYRLREDDLIFRRGLLFERIVAVPYGRLQLVDVTRGPLLRALGLTTLEFVTAAEATGVKLPGLPDAEAESLRDRLIALAETRRSGL